MNSFESLNNENQEQYKTEEARDVLLEIIEEKNRPRFHFSQEEEIKKEKEIEVLTEYDKTLRRLLLCWGIEDVAIKKVANGIFTIPLTDRSESIRTETLPSGYGYKGGKARTLLLREFNIDPEAEARDVDLIRIREGNMQTKDVELAKQYSPDDFEHNYGVEPIEKDYFETRDFTMNELIAVNDAIYFTKQCFLDTVRRIVRFSDFEKKELWYPEEHGVENGYFVKDKLMAKAVRLSASEMTRGKKMEIANREIYTYLEINDFHIALHLDRALQEGRDVARQYIEKLIELGQLPKDINSPEQFIRGFITRMEDEEGFLFRYAPKTQLEKEDDMLYTIEKEIMEDEALRETEYGKKLLAQIRYEKFEEDVDR